MGPPRLFRLPQRTPRGRARPGAGLLLATAIVLWLRNYPRAISRASSEPRAAPPTSLNPNALLGFYQPLFTDLTCQLSLYPSFPGVATLLRGLAPPSRCSCLTAFAGSIMRAVSAGEEAPAPSASAERSP